MFDKSLVIGVAAPRGPSGPSTVHVHEHKAPVADDARLLSEVEKEAWKRITNVLVQESKDNVLNAVEFHLQKNVIQQTTMFILLFTLNGVKHECRGDTHEETVREAFKIVADTVLASIFKSHEFYQDIRRNFSEER